LLWRYCSWLPLPFPRWLSNRALLRRNLRRLHQTFGLGFLLGDGHLNYGREDIFESYYTMHVFRGIYLAPGVQHISDPGDNRDRGPVVVPSFRAHIEF